MVPRTFAALVLAVAASPALAQNATVDLRDADLVRGLRRVAVADGDTVPITLAGLRARQNEDPAADHYLYFDVADSLLFARTPVEVRVTFHYFDRPGLTLRLQYDAATSPYKETPAFQTTGTNTWKVRTEVLRDAWFANRQNGGADFRVAAPPGASFALDLVYVRVPAARMPAVRVSPAQGEEVRPGPWRDLCARWDEWPAARGRVDMVGSADHLIASVADGELADCFARIDGAGLALSLEVPVLKQAPECRTGAGCLAARAPVWQRLTGLGAVVGSFYMDEPFLAARTYPDLLGLSDAAAVNQVLTWMRLVRERYPHAQLIQVEPYPALSAADLGWWLRALHEACAAQGEPILDFFVLDHDWTAPGWSFPDISGIQAQSRALGVPFGVLFWAANKKTATTDVAWRRGLMRQGWKYKRAGIVPDLYDINDFMDIPAATVPEGERNTYTSSVKAFTGMFVRRR